MYTTIIWATDGSDAADAALEEALRLAALTGARLLAIHCDQPVDEPGLRERLERQAASLRAKDVDAELVVESTSPEPWHVVARVAQQRRADLIVCGTRGLGTLSGAFLGSFTQRLLHDAPCPVLVVGPRSRLNEAVAEPRDGSAR